MQAGESSREKTTLTGTVVRITYHHPGTLYTVARLEIDGAAAVTIVGGIHPIAEGEEIKVSGAWKTHPRYGLQFHVEHWQKIEPATVEGIEKYLGSGLIKGIGPAYAKRLVDAFGLETLRVLSEEPLRIFEVEGIGEIRGRRIMDAWQAQRGMQDVMIFLQGHGVSPSLALKIYRVYGADSVAKVKENPYALARDIHGIGFVLADRIAASLGIRNDSPRRIEAGTLHLLGEFAERGHCFVPRPHLCKAAGELLGIDEEKVLSALERLSEEGQVIAQSSPDLDPPRIYLSALYHAEQRVAEALHRLLSTPSFLKEEWSGSRPDKRGQPPRGAIEFSRAEFAALAPIELDEEQIQAARSALEEKVFIITGGPGTGKTTLLKSLLAILRRAKVSFALAAPTGRAAKRMQETAGEEATTIHRLLEYNPREGGFQRDEDRPLAVDVVIIDEASMVDLTLMDHLLKAMDPHSHLILIGDVDQLPSVGPGAVLKDMIASGVIPVAVLRRIFRQRNQSLIVVNAHRILEGRPLELAGSRERREFDFVPRESEPEILETVKELLRERVPSLLGVDPETVIRSVQILTPMHRGMLGTLHLNRELQQLLNPAGEGLERSGAMLRVGDKVMQLRNNYDRGVFNGDVGRVVRVNREEGKLDVDFDDRVVEYDADELDELSLAYATSIHKSQGSEYPAVIIPLHTSHYMMLYRSILYTAVTRGKKLVFVVGSRRALAMAIRNVRVETRNTGLRERLATGVVR